MGETSKNPFQTAKPIRNETEEDLVHAGLAELAQLARQAFEEKRRKQSLTLTNAILKIDPENKEAFVVQSWVRADLQQDFEAASTLVDEARAQQSAASYERAERLLRSILIVDAENERARALLGEVVSEQSALAEKDVSGEMDATTQTPLHTFPATDPATEGRPRRWTRLLLPVVLVAIVFGLIKLATRDDSPTRQIQKSKNENATSPPGRDATTGSLDLFVLPSVGVEVRVDDSPAQPVPRTIDLPSGTHRLSFTADGYVPETVSQTVEAGKQHVLLPIVMTRVEDNAVQATPANAEASKPQTAGDAASAASRVPNPSDRFPDPAANAGATTRAMGSLALSAVAPVDIYLAGKYLGSTPLTLQLPPGPQTLEFRDRGFRKTATYIVETNKTIRASVAFEVDLQINAKPWAEVSVEGGEHETLGQTPLSNVRVSVGTVLVFHNPNYPEKKYVVTGKEQAIQVVFP